jgi:alkaline phosphatase
VAAPSVRTRVARAAVSVGMAVAMGACGAPADAPAAGAREEVARNVILFLADGLGQKQHDFLQLALAGPTGELAMDRLGVTGSMDPSPAAYDLVADSAAAATTIATGVPTAAGRIGVDDDGEPLPTVLERARDAGKATGLVTTAEVTDATPAAFAAHVDPTRVRVTETPEEAEERPDDEDDLEGMVARSIARQYLEKSRVDVILGGGAQRWSGLVAPGYATVSDAASLRAASADRLLGLFGAGPMFVPGGRLEGRYAPAVPLPDMTRAALETLDRREAGFFLVVAEEGIDAMASQGDGALVLEAGRALDRAVQVAMEFRAANPDTLIVVAGSHETGGMDLTLAEPGAVPVGADGPYPAADSDGELWLRWTREGPTDALTPVTAGGPGAEAFEGDILITQLFPALLEAMSVRA